MSIENSCVRLDEGRWNPKNRKVLEKLIEKYRNTNSYAAFDWDNTSIAPASIKNFLLLSTFAFSKSILVITPITSFLGNIVENFGGNSVAPSMAD